MAEALIEDAEANARYVPYGAFRVGLPEEITRLIEEIPVSISPGGEEPDIPIQIRLTSLLAFAAEDRHWVRFGNQDGDGPIFLWRPGRLPSDNMLSDSFRSIANAVLSALWRDLRANGPQSVSQTRPQSPRPGQSPGKTAGRNRRRASRTPAVRVLPRIGSRHRLELRGPIEWSSQAEREAVRRRAHGVTGHPRRLLPGQKAGGEQIAYARTRGIILPPTHTFVRPHTRSAGDAPGRVEPLDATPVVSKGLATLLAFLDKGVD